MTLRDVEVIELLADEPELLAIADAVSATRPKITQPKVTSLRRRRLVVRAAIVAVAAVVAVLVVLAAPQGHSGSVLDRAGRSILGRARAAVGTGQIMHVVTEGPAGTEYVDLKTGRRTPVVLREELWTTRHAHALHVVTSVNGHAVADLSPGDRGYGVFAGPGSPAFVALWTGYQAAQHNKYAPTKLGGRGTVDGHSVYWLRFPVWFRGCVRVQPKTEKCLEVGGPTRFSQTEVAIDTHTYEPILERTYEQGKRFDTRILVAKAIAYHPPELYRRRGPKLFVGMSPGHPFGAHPFAGHRSSRVMSPPWLTAGDTVAGLRFRHVSRLFSQPLDQVATLPYVWRLAYRAVELVYTPGTTIDETLRPADPRPWAGLPPGSVEIQPGESVTNTGSDRLWTGYLVKHGVYITITTPAGEDAVVQIARALRRS